MRSFLKAICRKSSSLLSLGCSFWKSAATLEEQAARATWKQADSVCFDVDSTVFVDEGIEELAKLTNCAEEMGILTRKAMQGEIPLKLAITKSLDLLQPSRQLMERYLKEHPPALTPGIKELVSTLHCKDIPVYLVSGGYDTIIDPAAVILNIPSHRVFANRLKYYYKGEYAGFDEARPTVEQDGKARVASHLKSTYGYKTLIMVGDSVTDMGACPPADLFIGFGGNKIRDVVKQEAKWFVMSFDELRKELIEP